MGFMNQPKDDFENLFGMRRAHREMCLQEKKGKEVSVHLADGIYSLFPELGTKRESSPSEKMCCVCVVQTARAAGARRRQRARPTRAWQTGGEAGDEARGHVAPLGRPGGARALGEGQEQRCGGWDTHDVFKGQ